MNRKIFKIFGLGMTLLLLSSLIVTLTMSTPATAGTQKWTRISIPGTDDMQLAPGTDVGAIAVSPDGYTLFAAVYAESGCVVLTPGNWYVYKSVDGGYTWKATGYNGDGTPTEQIVAIDISPLWVDDDRIAVATTADVYKSTDRGKTFASMGATGLGNITSMDVDLDQDGDAAYLIGTSQDVYIYDGFSEWMRQNVAGGNSSNVLAVAFSPNYDTDGIFAVLQEYGSSPATTTLRVETDIEAHNWGSYIYDAPFKDGESEAAINAESASMAFADDFSGAPSVFIGLVVYNGTAQNGDAYRVDLSTIGTSTANDLDIRGEDTQTNVNSIAISGEASSASILAGMRDLVSSGPMSNWVAQVHYSANGGASWLHSYKPPSGMNAETCAPLIVMAPDFADSGIAYCGNGFLSIAKPSSFSGFYVSTTQGTTWNGRGLLDIDIDEIEDIVPSPDYDNDSTIFMVTRDAYVPDATLPLTNFGLLWKTEDGGSSWELILGMTLMQPLPGVNIDTIRIPAYYPDEPSIFVTGPDDLLGYPSAVVVRSTDEGNLFATTFRAPYDAGTPQPIDSWVVIDHKTLIVSNGSDIWKTADMGAHWNETDGSEIDPNETVVDMQLFNDSVVLVGTDCGSVYMCPDWETDFSFTKVGNITLGSDNSVYVAFGANFDDNGYVYAGVTDTGDNDGQEGIWRVNASSSDSWDRLYDAGEDIYSIAYNGEGMLWALADGSAIRSLNPAAADPDDVGFTIVNTGLTSILTGDLETAGEILLAIGGVNSTELWTYNINVTQAWVDDDFNASTAGWGYDHFASIQDGIDAVSGSTVNVAEGTYYENIVLKDGVELLGAGNATTIIDGMQSGSVITANNLGNTTFLAGFTVTNGSNDNGGGMYNNNASPVITNCTFQNNIATSDGGGMYNIYSSSPIATNCVFRDNSAHSGSGIYNTGSLITTHCAFQNNSAVHGGGIYSTGSPTISNCTFQNNSAESAGGGFCGLGSPMVTNCLFQENDAYYGGGIYTSYCTFTIINCVFKDNYATWGGGVGRDVHPTIEGSLTITNCVFWNNWALEGGGIGAIGCTITNCILWNNSPDGISGADPLIVTYSDVQGGYPGEGNIDSDPIFVNASAGDFHLSAGSPCIDTGNNSAPSIPATDFEGDDRIFNGIVDMGVDEYVSFDPGDVNCDGDVDLFDLVRLGLHWGETGTVGWIPEDVNNDGVIDLFDLVILGIYWTG